MTYSCVAINCTNKRTRSKHKESGPTGLSFHKFPLDEDLRQKWLLEMRRENWEPTKYSKLCSEHFSRKCFSHINGRSYLQPNSIPTIFDFPPHLQKSTVKERSNCKCHADMVVEEMAEGRNHCSGTCEPWTMEDYQPKVEIVNVKEEMVDESMESEGFDIEESIEMVKHDIVDREYKVAEDVVEDEQTIVKEEMDDESIESEGFDIEETSEMEKHDIVDREYKIAEDVAEDEQTIDTQIISPLEMIKKESTEDPLDLTSCERFSDDQFYQIEDIKDEDTVNVSYGHLNFEPTTSNNNEVTFHGGLKTVPVEKDNNNDIKTCNSKTVDQHVNTVHDMTPKIFKCDKCGKDFTQTRSLSEFVKGCTSTKAVQCDTCRNSHVQNETSKREKQNGKKSFGCDSCGEQFTIKGNLQRHLIIHGKKPFRCDTCGKCFTRKDHLKMHTGIHAGMKPYKCDMCEKCFAYKVTLKIHAAIHTGLMPFKCDTCGACFAYLHVLKRHKKIHLGGKPFKCDMCGECFAKKLNLKIHTGLHDVVKSFKRDTVEMF